MGTPRHHTIRKKISRSSDHYGKAFNLLKQSPGDALIVLPIFEELQKFGAMTMLNNKKISDAAVALFFKEMAGKLLVDAVIRKRTTQNKKVFSNYAKKLEKILLELSFALDEPLAKNFYHDFSIRPLHSNGGITNVFKAAKRIREAAGASSFHESVRWTVDFLLIMRTETAQMFRNDSGITNKVARGALNRSVVFAASKAEEILGGRFPSFLVSFFNSQKAQGVYGHGRLTVPGVEKLLERAARKGMIKGLKSKPNPAKKS